MLGEPVAVVAEPVGRLCQVEGLPDRLAGGLSLSYRGLIEDAQPEGGARGDGHMTSLARPSRPSKDATKTATSRRARLRLARALELEVDRSQALQQSIELDR